MTKAADALEYLREARRVVTPDGTSVFVLPWELREYILSAIEARHTTVERIRERLADNHNILGAEFYRLDQIDAILDEESVNAESLRLGDYGDRRGKP